MLIVQYIEINAYGSELNNSIVKVLKVQWFEEIHKSEVLDKIQGGLMLHSRNRIETFR